MSLLPYETSPSVVKSIKRQISNNKIGIKRLNRANKFWTFTNQYYKPIHSIFRTSHSRENKSLKRGKKASIFVPPKSRNGSSTHSLTLDNATRDLSLDSKIQLNWITNNSIEIQNKTSIHLKTKTAVGNLRTKFLSKNLGN